MKPSYLQIKLLEREDNALRTKPTKRSTYLYLSYARRGTYLHQSTRYSDCFIACSLTYSSISTAGSQRGSRNTRRPRGHASQSPATSDDGNSLERLEAKIIEQITQINHLVVSTEGLQTSIHKLVQQLSTLHILSTITAPISRTRETTAKTINLNSPPPPPIPN